MRLTKSAAIRMMASLLQNPTINAAAIATLRTAKIHDRSKGKGRGSPMVRISANKPYCKTAGMPHNEWNRSKEYQRRQRQIQYGMLKAG